MKTIFFILISFGAINVFAQNDTKVDEPNLIEQKNAVFYKDSWKPFTGNTIIKSKEPDFTYLIKVLNGIEYYTEVYDENDNIIEIIENGIYKDFDTLTLKSLFTKNQKFTDTSKVNFQNIVITYQQDSKTGEKEKLKGVVKYDFTKEYYSNGTLTKIETFYDKKCNVIKDSHEIFSTEIGNLFLYKDEIESNYHGEYKIWNEKGELIDSGKYKMGVKIDE